MNLPLEQSMERAKLTIQLDPRGLWSRFRFEFCNALEDFCDLTDDAKARAELERLGVTILDSQSPNGEARSSVGKGE